MKYTISNTIDKPIKVVADKFMQPDGALQWMEALTKLEEKQTIVWATNPF